MALFPTNLDATFWYDFESLTDGNLWTDKSKNSLHATPQAGFTAPAYGLGRTSRGKGYATFTGAANFYATLPLRFYDVAPTGEFTFVVAHNTMTSTGINRLFSCWNNGAGGINRGVLMDYWPGGRAHYVYTGQGGAAFPQWNTAGTSPTKAAQDAVVVAVTKTAPYILFDRQVALSPAWAAGAFGTTVHDATIAPAIGASVGGGSYYNGRMAFLALFPFVFTHQQAQAMSDWLRNQV